MNQIKAMKTKQTNGGIGKMNATFLWRVIYLLIGLFCFWMVYQIYFKNPEGNKIERITITLADQPQQTIDDHLNNRRKNLKSYYLTFRAKEFPEFVFMLSSDTYYKSNVRKILSLSSGTQISIGLQSSVLKEKLLKTEAPSFITRHSNLHAIDVFEIAYKKNYYTPKLKSNEVYEDDSIMGLFLSCVGLLSLWAGWNT